jgi:hypothetical protein
MRNEIKPFTRLDRLLCARRNTIRLSRHTSSPSVDSQTVRMHHMMRATTRTDMTETEIRVAEFEILKQKSNNAMKKIIILSAVVRFHEVNRGKLRRRTTT